MVPTDFGKDAADSGGTSRRNACTTQDRGKLRDAEGGVQQGPRRAKEVDLFVLASLVPLRSLLMQRDGWRRETTVVLDAEQRRIGCGMRFEGEGRRRRKGEERVYEGCIADMRKLD